MTKKSDYYRARQAFGVSYQGEFVTVAAGEIVPAGSPLLKQLGKDAVQEHFEPVTSFGRWDPPDETEPEPEPEVEQATAEPEPELEQATAAPGEKRRPANGRRKENR
jgi:hypothetical protein